jgi:hypothetical protein
MPGIAKIAGRRDEERVNTQFTPTRDLFLKDGDTAYVSFVPTGDEDDNRLDSLWIHTIQKTSDSGQKLFDSIVCQRTEDNDQCEFCAEDNRAQHQFALWTYVYYILHPTQANDEWTLEQTAGGNKRYKETVENYRVFRRGFGRSDYLWNNLVDIYTENGALNKFVTRIKRTGSGMQDTSYSIIVTSTPVKLTKDLRVEGSELGAIAEYLKENLGANLKTAPVASVSTLPTTSDATVAPDAVDGDGEIDSDLDSLFDEEDD